MTGCSIFSTAQ